MAINLVKEYRICQVIATERPRQPYVFRAREVNGNIWSEVQAELTMDQETCQGFKITPSVDLVGRVLRIRLKPRVLKRIEEGNKETQVFSSADMEDRQRNEVLITRIVQHEEWRQAYGSASPYDKLFQHVEYFLFATTDNRDEKDRLQHCPFYQLLVDLTETEFMAYNRLAPGTVLGISLELLPAGYKKEREG